MKSKGNDGRGGGGAAARTAVLVAREHRRAQWLRSKALASAIPLDHQAAPSNPNNNQVGGRSLSSLVVERLAVASMRGNADVASKESILGAALKVLGRDFRDLNDPEKRKSMKKKKRQRQRSGGRKDGEELDLESGDGYGTVLSLQLSALTSCFQRGLDAHDAAGDATKRALGIGSGADVQPNEAKLAAFTHLSDATDMAAHLVR